MLCITLYWKHLSLFSTVTLKGNSQTALVERFCLTRFLSTFGGLSVLSTNILRAVLAVKFSEVGLCSSLLSRGSELKIDFSIYQGSQQGDHYKLESSLTNHTFFENLVLIESFFSRLRDGKFQLPLFYTMTSKTLVSHLFL